MFKRKTHKEKLIRLNKKLKKAQEKRKERQLRWEIFKTYLPSFSIAKFNIKFSKLSVIISFISVCAYTISSLLLQKFLMVEVSPTLTTCVFAFFGTELIALSTIKNKQTKLNTDILQHENFESHYE